jgi:hypothetical protein
LLNPKGKTGACIDAHGETYKQDEKGFTIWKGFSHSGAFSICCSISLESLVAKKAMDLKV